MLRMSVMPFVFLVVTTYLTGCATVVRGTSQDISISSNPVGASITIDNTHFGVTPTIVSLYRGDSHNVLIYLDGYEPLTARINSRTDAAIAGNCLLGGIPGIAIDAVTGSAKILTPDVISVALVPVDGSLPPIQQPPRQVQVPAPAQVPRQSAFFEEVAREAIGAVAFGCFVVLIVVVYLSAEH